MLDDHGARDVPPGVVHQVLEQREFLHREFDSLAGALHNPLHPVQFQISHHQH